MEDLPNLPVLLFLPRWAEPIRESGQGRGLKEASIQHLALLCSKREQQETVLLSEYELHQHRVMGGWGTSARQYAAIKLGSWGLDGIACNPKSSGRLKVQGQPG